MFCAGEKKFESPEVFTSGENNFTIPVGSLPGDYSTLAINLAFEEEEHIYQDFQSVYGGHNLDDFDDAGRYHWVKG